MEAFVRVADASSFAEAARRWGRSKTAVSKYVARLEEHLGISLLRRTTRAVSVTDAGRTHYEKCVEVLALVEQAEARLTQDDAAPAGLLRISAPAGLLSMSEPSLVMSFLRRFPNVELDLNINTRLVDLVEERIDLAIRITQPSDSSLIARKIAPVRSILAASPRYLEAHGRPDTPEELTQHQCLLESGFKNQARWPFKVNGREFHVAVSGPVRTNDIFMAINLALEGLGIILVGRPVVQRYLLSGTLQEVLPGTINLHRSAYAVTSQRRLQPRRVLVFIDHLKRFLPGALNQKEPDT